MAFLKGCRRSSSATYEPCCGTDISGSRCERESRTHCKPYLNHALRRGRGLWTASGQKALQALSLAGYTSQRRDELLRLYVQLQQRIQELDGQVERQVQQRPQALRLLTHPGVGPVTALTTEVFLGDPSRFANGKNVASYIGMIPCEHT